MKSGYAIVKEYYGDFDISKQEIVGVSTLETTAKSVCSDLNSKRTKDDLDNEITYKIVKSKLYV